MGALPKNKITRSERGRRRAGNTPKLQKSLKTARVPASKKKFVTKLLDFAGLK